MISAVRSSDFECQLQAERDKVKHCFAYNHVNFATYITYQHVSLRTMEHNNHPTIDELKTRRFECNLSGGEFSSINGDFCDRNFKGRDQAPSWP